MTTLTIHLTDDEAKALKQELSRNVRSLSGRYGNQGINRRIRDQRDKLNVDTHYPAAISAVKKIIEEL